MRVSDMVIMILLVSIIMIGCSAFVGSFATAYNVDATDISYLNQTTQVTEKVKQMHESIAKVNQTSENPVINAWNYIGFVSASLMNTATLFLSAPFMLQNMLTNDAGSGLLDMIGVPAWIIGIFISIIIALIGFAVYRAIAKTDI